MPRQGGQHGATTGRVFPGLNVPDNPDQATADPTSLGNILGQLFQLRGYGRKRADRQLQQVWSEVAGTEIAARSKAQAIKSGVLQVCVTNGVVLNELVGYLKHEILEKLRTNHASLRIRDIKFRLKDGRR